MELDFKVQEKNKIKLLLIYMFSQGHDDTQLKSQQPGRFGQYS